MRFVGRLTERRFCRPHWMALYEHMTFKGFQCFYRCEHIKEYLRCCFQLRFKSVENFKISLPLRRKRRREANFNSLYCSIDSTCLTSAFEFSALKKIMIIFQIQPRNLDYSETTAWHRSSPKFRTLCSWMDDKLNCGGRTCCGDRRVNL